MLNWVLICEQSGQQGIINNMRKWGIIAIAAVVTVMPEIGLSLESPALSSPVGSGTVPPTTYKSGLVPSINPVDTSGNLIVTGNVAGEGYFRGVVPYGGVTNFLTPAGEIGHTTGAFDSFLRRTSGSQSYERSGGGLTPYYSPSMTVTTQVPGTRGVTTSQIPGTTPEETYYRTTAPQQQTGYYQREYAPQSMTRPLSLSRVEMEKLIQQDAERVPLGGEPTSEVQSFERFWRDMGIQVEQRPMQTEDKDREAGPYGLEVGEKPDISTLLGLKKELEKRPPSETGKETPASALASGEAEPGQLLGAPKVSIYEQMKEQTAGPEVGLGGLKDSAGESILNQALKSPGGQEPNRPAGVLSSAGAAAVDAGGGLRVYKSFAVFRDDGFNKHIRAAENYMKEGRFYRAADAYTLATAYKPDDPLGYAGKSIALFATGEYMSSSLFLARALEIFPEYAKVRIDLFAMVGDKDTVEKRILDIREWATRSDSGELEFLLSYIYYQLDRMEFAKMMIKKAAEKMPDSIAVAAMKKAIDGRAASF